jgi:hypothetical protein
MGRPLLNPDLRRDWTHSVNFYEPEYREISRHAVRKGIAIAKFLRDAALEKPEKEKREAAR